jgi:hypothetical protein
MADLGLWPFASSKNLHSFTGKTTDALAKYGSVVVSAASTDSSEIVTTASAGANLVMGVVIDQGDPNNSGLHANGSFVSVQDMGDCEILVLGGVTYAVGDILICTTTAGVAGKYTSGSTYDQIGTVTQAVTTGTLPQLISCRLNIVKRAA